MTKIIEVIQDDYGYEETFNLQDSAGNAIDITGATVSLKVQAVNDKTALKFTGGMSIINAAGGVCRYTVASGNFDTVGTFNAEITVDYGGSPGRVIRYTDIQFVVKPKLPRTG